ncbi:MAG: CoA pyrophosphatase [Thermodesulfobacteriota bacterium]|nr:CoA pyrophosphatase [Thermodesulfobacteriota bacterium]
MEIYTSIKNVLSKRDTAQLEIPGYKPSAVLMLLFYKYDVLHVITTKRTEKVQYHKGQICFPGGAFEHNDVTLEETGLRECYEEIGVHKEDVNILGKIDEFTTRTSNYIITPFVATMPYPYRFELNAYEIERIIEIPLQIIRKTMKMSGKFTMNNGLTVPTYIFEHHDDTIWGATAHILKHFLDLLEEEKLIDTI